MSEFSVYPSFTWSSTSQFPNSESSVSKHRTLAFYEFKILLNNTMNFVSKVVQQSEDVYVDLEAMKKKAKEIIEHVSIYNAEDTLIRSFSVNMRHLCLFNFYKKDVRIVLNWLFVLNALNYSLWYPRNTKQWTVEGLTGYEALFSAINRAIVKEGKPMWDPVYYSQLSQCEVEIIFRGDDPKIKIPLIDERIKTLREIGKVLLDKYKGTFVNCFTICEKDATKLLHLLYNEFETYRDTVYYEGQEIYFGCKAVALARDLKFIDQSFENIIPIPAIFIDYHAPRTLLKLGFLQYSPKLQCRFAEIDEPLEYGSREEIEIRCCSLFVCQELTYEVQSIFFKKYDDFDLKTIYFTPVVSENILWSNRKTLDKKRFNNIVPFHNIRSVYY